MNIGRRIFVLAVALFCIVGSEGQVPARRSAPLIPSLTEPGEGLTIREVSASTGFVTFASSGQKGILLALQPGTSAEARAKNFVDLYGAEFGLTDSSQVEMRRPAEVDELGVEHVRLQQVHEGIPVRAGELLVHLDGLRVVVVNGHVIDDFPQSLTPNVTPARARAVAQALIEKHRPDRAVGAQYSEPRLEIFNRGLFPDGTEQRSRLAWFVEATGPVLREFIWIDAQQGVILLHFNQLAEAKSRQVYNGNHLSTLPGTLVRSEGGPATGDADQDNAYTYAGVTYDYYLNNHGRDSFDNAGGAIRSTAHHCGEGFPQGSCPTYQNAFWNGTQMVYGDGFASADDVVGHEITHAVTERTSDLFYYVQGGALNESFSDIFGETIDLSDGVGNDSAGMRWKLGEDLPNGANRDMMNPNTFGDPGRISDSAYFVCGTDDSGGVHTNSGIPNHAFALMVDGGTYNSTTITGIGLTKAAKIEYRALTVYLTSGAGFSDDYNALNQSCTDLIGVVGITAADCTQVTKALQAVELNNRWPCAGATHAPPLCSTGIATNVFFDNFESVTGNWTATNSYGGWSSHSTAFAKSGTFEAFGDDPDDVSDHNLAKTLALTVPAGGRLYFDHAFEFENGPPFAFDGGVVEYSVNGGATWLDGGGLIDAGQSYNGSIESGFGNPLGGRGGFVDSSFGYTGTRLNLSSLAGQSVKIRFRIGSDVTVGSLGWVVDNVAIYTCTAPASGILAVVDTATNLGTVNVSTESSTVTGSSGIVLTDVARTSTGAMYGIDFSNLYSINPGTGARTLIGPLGGGGNGMNALVGYGANLLAASVNSTSLFSVNASTGVATPLTGSLGFVSMGDLAFHNGSLYASVQNGAFSDLVRVSLTGSSFTAANLGHVTSDNALFGLAEGTDHNLYGFTGRSVLRINTANPPASQVVVFDYNANHSGLGVANGAASPPSATFTDDPLIQGLNIVRSLHVLELRSRIAAIRTAKGLGAFAFNDPTLTPASTLIRGQHIDDLRTALGQAYTAAGATLPAYTDPSLGGLTPKAIHIMELRAAVLAIE